MRVLPLFLSGCIIDTQIWGPGDDTDDPDPWLLDGDGDGFQRDDGDCDDTDLTIFPGATEGCDGIDNDCLGGADVVGKSGLEVCHAQERFDQTLRADVLIVIDNTESMREIWPKAAEGACAMVQHLLGPTFDTQIGVLMTDLQSEGADGSLVEVSQKEGDPWITGNGPGINFVSACHWLTFAIGDVVPYTPVEPDPSGGRAAVEAAMTAHGDTNNDGFFRPDADLAILFVSDQEDNPEPNNDEFLAMVEKQKLGSGARLTVHAITQIDEESCEGQKTEVRASSVLELVDRTAGSVASHCMDANGYVGFLTGVGQDIAQNGLGDRFYLPQNAPARLGTVEVSIDAGNGDPYPWAGAVALEDPWTLVFAADNRPPAGSTIIVDYKVDYTLLSP